MTGPTKSDLTPSPEPPPHRAPACPLSEYLDNYAGEPLWQPVVLLAWLFGQREEVVLARTEQESHKACEAWRAGHRRIRIELHAIEQRLIAVAHEAKFSGGELHRAISTITAALVAITAPLPRMTLRRWIEADRVSVARRFGWPPSASTFGDDFNEWLLFREANAEAFRESDTALQAVRIALTPIMDIANRIKRLNSSAHQEPMTSAISKKMKIPTAIGLLPKYGHLSDVRIAEMVGCHPKSLSKNPKFRAARKALREVGRSELRKGKSRGPDMDEYEDGD